MADFLVYEGSNLDDENASTAFPEDDRSSVVGSVGDTPGNELHCANARECEGWNLKWSEFLLDDPEASWYGKIWGYCYDCSPHTDPKIFKRECKRMAEARAKLKRGHRVRSKTMTFANMKQKIKEALPKISSAKLVQLTYLRMKATAVAICAAFDKDNKFAQEAKATVVKEWLDEVEKCADDPSYAATTDAKRMLAWECSYFTKICDGVFFSYLCRKGGCGFFGPNNEETWMKHLVRWWFRCPLCGFQHQPSATREGDVPATRILSLLDFESGEMRHIPTSNPPSEDEGWLNKMIEIQALQIESQEDLDLWHRGAAVDYKKLLEKECLDEVFQKIEYNPNKHTAVVDSRTFNSSVQLERGWVLGAVMTDDEAKRQPFSDWNGLISVVANYVAVNRVIASKRT